MSGDLSKRQLVFVTIGIMLALFLAALDQTIVGTAMPRIVADLHGLDYYAWVLTAYMVASTTMTPIAGKLSDLFGRKPLLLVGMIGFIAASALCGQSQNMAALVMFRGLQGLFGGVLFATVFASIADLFPPAARGRVQGAFGGVFGLASVVGPTVGGYLTDSLSWRWVFYVNVPLGLLAVLFVLFTMPHTRTTASWRHIDFAGMAALTAGLVPLLVALSITGDHAWGSPEVLGLLAVGVVALFGFVLVERRADHPIVPLHLFRNRVFLVSVTVGFCVSFGMFGAILYVPLIYQGVLGISATSSGALLTPMMLGIVFGAITSGQLTTRIRRYRFIGTFGMALVITGLWLLAQVSPSTDPIEVVRDLVLVGLGIGSTFPLYLSAVQSALPRSITGVVSSQVQFWRNIGGTVGIAVLGSILTQRLADNIQQRLAALQLPPEALASLGQAGNAQALFDPARLAAAPPQVLEAIRAALAATLHDLFFYGLVAVVIGLVASVFLDDVPLRGHDAAASAEGKPVAAFGA